MLEDQQPRILEKQGEQALLSMQRAKVFGFVEARQGWCALQTLHRVFREETSADGWDMR